MKVQRGGIGVLKYRGWNHLLHGGKLNGGQRGFGWMGKLASGHNRWSTIRHDKGKNDAMKNNLFNNLLKDIEMASKSEYNGEANSSVRLTPAITKAKKAAVPKSLIEAAIARGKGNFKVDSGENVQLEALLPFSMALILECHATNKLQKLGELRRIIRDFGGTITATAYLFDRRGRIMIDNLGDKYEIGLEEMLEWGIETGVQDIEECSSGEVMIYTEPDKLNTTLKLVCEKFGINVKKADLIWEAKKDQLVQLNDEMDIILKQFFQKLETRGHNVKAYTNVKSS